MFTFAAVLAAALAVSTAHAQYFGPGVPQAPDCCGPSYYAPNWFGQYYGPNYNLYPGYGPYNGPVDYPRFTVQPNGTFGLGGGTAVAPPLSFPTNPYMRGPRDFFMADDESSPRRRPVWIRLLGAGRSSALPRAECGSSYAHACHVPVVPAPVAPPRRLLLSRILR